MSGFGFRDVGGGLLHCGLGPHKPDVTVTSSCWETGVALVEKMGMTRCISHLTWASVGCPVARLGWAGHRA